MVFWAIIEILSYRILHNLSNKKREKFKLSLFLLKNNAILRKSYQQVFYCFSLFSSDSFKGFFGSINGILFHWKNMSKQHSVFIGLKNPIKSPLSFLCNYKSPPLFLRSMKENYYCPVKISTILYLTQIHQVASVLQKGACLFVLCKIGSTKHKKDFRRHLYK